MSQTVYPEDIIRELTAKVDGAKMETVEEAEEFYRNLMTLVWNYKMVGKLFDHYVPGIHVYRENGDDMVGIKAVVQDVMAVEAAFPDVKMEIVDIVTNGNQEDGYEMFTRRYLTGSNQGFSKYGAPTQQDLGENCMSLNMFKLEKIGDRWQIVSEYCLHSIRTIRTAMGAKQ